MSNLPEALVSMAQTLAASRHGAPLDIPQNVITRAVSDCADLLDSTADQRDRAHAEICRRTRKPSDSLAGALAGGCLSENFS